MSKINFEEKRRYVRIPIETLVTFTINNDIDSTKRGTSQNISAGGVYITTDYAVKLGDHIKIILNADANHLEPLIAEGRVVRCRFDKKNSNLFHVSVEFFEIHETWIQVVTAE